MASATQGPRPLRFGVFELDLQSGELRKQGLKVRLPDQAFRMLVLLLEHPGQVVRREELQRKLWPENTFVDFDIGLASAVKKLRNALGDSAENPRFVETIPRRGYRFIGPVPSNAEVATIQAPSGNNSFEAVQPRLRRHVRLSGLAVAALMLICGLGFWLLFRPVTTPRVVRMTQLTRFGLAWSNSKIATDGFRIYFTRREAYHYDIVEVPVGGGDPIPVVMPFSGAALYDISPDKSMLLVGADPRWGDELLPVWLLPAAGGKARRLGEVFASDAVWCGEGSRIIFAGASKLYSANAEGGSIQLLAEVPGTMQHLACSPSGDKVRFALRNPQTGSFALWQLSVSRSKPKPLFESRRGTAGSLEDESGGSWTSDGQHYLFTSTHNGQSSLWTISEAAHPWRRRGSTPMSLYDGATFLSVPSPAAGANRVFVVGDEPENRETIRFEPVSRHFEPFLAGTPARWFKYSRSGQWIAYVNTRDYTLWRSRADGSEPVQLTSAPMTAFTPDWSPDGTQLAFVGYLPGKPNKIYVVSRDGGLSYPITGDSEREWDPNWSVDGKSLLFGHIWYSFELGTTGIFKFDLSTKHVSLLPGSSTSARPVLSHNGHSLAALTAGGKELVLFVSGSNKSIKLADGEGLHNVFWSHDDRFIYFQDLLNGREQPILRVRISDGKVEHVLDRNQLLRGYVRSFALTGLTPTDDLLVTVVTGKADLYALDLDLP